jgi:hypothetical protein
MNWKSTGKKISDRKSDRSRAKRFKKLTQEFLTTTWTIGDVVALIAFAVGSGLVAIALAIQLGDALLEVTRWAWTSAGGESANSADQSMARAAWAGVVVGVVTIVFLGFTLAYTGIATQISLLSVQQAQLLGQSQVRAYIGAHDITFAFPKGADFTEAPEIRIKLTNTGQTPARRVRIRMGWQNFQPRELIQIIDSERYSVQELGAGQTIVERIPCGHFREDILMDHVVGAASSFVQGVIEYRDVFDSTHSTWFRALITGDYTEAEPRLYVEWTQAGNVST